MLTFTFDADLTRGNREIEVQATYEINRTDGSVRVIDVDRDDITEAEFERLDDIAADRADEDYAEWLADYGEYLRDSREDRLHATECRSGRVAEQRKEAA